MYKRGVVSDLSLASCGISGRGGHVKSVSHLFVTCRVTSELWYRIFMWLKLPLILLNNMLVLCEIFISSTSSLELRGSFVMV